VFIVQLTPRYFSASLKLFHDERTGTQAYTCITDYMAASRRNSKGRAIMLYDCEEIVASVFYSGSFPVQVPS